MRKTIKTVAILTYSLAVTAMAGHWAIGYAYMERGYEAIGGEYLFIPMVAVASYKTASIFLEALEEEFYVGKRRNQKRRGGRISRMRDYR